MWGHKPRGFSLIELLVVVAIILIIAAIAVPSLMRARINANNTAAAATIRTLNTAQINYSSTYATEGYSPSLRRLGPNGVNCSAGTVDFRHACLLDEEVACTSATGPCPKSGFNYYLFTSTAVAPVPDYVVAAGPISWDSSGSENWCSAADGVVRNSQNGTTPANASIGAAPDTNGCTDPNSYGPVR